MPVKFKYVPTSGALSGKSFEAQTEAAFNELGAEIDQIREIAEEVKRIAQTAVDTANAAMTTVQTAVDAANMAQTAAANATSAANMASAKADNAAARAAEAGQSARVAINTAGAARMAA